MTNSIWVIVDVFYLNNMIKKYLIDSQFIYHFRCLKIAKNSRN